jgi:hypothetical protein
MGLYFFSGARKKFILFCGFCNFGRCKLKKTKIVGEQERISIKLADGMGGVMSEGSLEGWKMQKHVQMNVEVRETSIANLVLIQVDLQNY